MSVISANFSAAPARQADTANPSALRPLYVLAWFLCAAFYFYQYAVRSAPGVMQEELTQAWGGNHIGSMIAAYYVAYALMALVAGILLDRYGAHATIPSGIAVVAVGCLVFAQGGEAAGMGGFVLQAMGAIFAFIGSSYVAARYLPPRMLALFVGLTQCLGMAGAAFGSKPVHLLIDPAGSVHMAWQQVWLGFAALGAVLAVATWLVMPREGGDSHTHHGPLSAGSLMVPFRTIFANRQSWIAGAIGGLLFVPTTIGALVWGTLMLHVGEGTSMAFAASDVSMVPIGWVIGCPLLGYISDRIGRRRPVLIGGAAVLLAACLVAVYVPVGIMPRYSVALVMGIASGAAMIPFSSMKEINPPQLKGTAAGVMNFMVFLTTGIMSPVVSALMGNGEQVSMPTIQHAFLPLIAGVVVAIGLAFCLRETGWKVNSQG
ncbi:MFS transporter [Gluconacetobacter azotocaptans]|uniref:Lysosomal dipeptide transporter MFSD1 n=1 Tax=Gluconacetobacter azotocaptans TaxID=142834 RepID=A0A7W4PF60_9PROT|nr:MFS transporter [Gluconacetobacter azotocaptans]MBB2188566.1 MFS transporter [Gluconacetobacter azotocaptans]GBQ28152.1 permease [Gluconacetobacter azotocaptans DSM 13594]